MSEINTLYANLKNPIQPDRADEASEPLTDHPLAGIFPMMPDTDLAALAIDIEENGQRAPIVLLGTQILDGRNRYRACRRIGIKPITCEFQGSDPLQFVLSANLHRRHLSESQRAMVAAKLANMANGGARAGAGRPCQSENAMCEASGGGNIQSANLPTEFSNGKAAEALNVSERSVRTAKGVLKDPEQTKAVETGRKTVSAAARELKEQANARRPASPEESARDATGYAIPRHLGPLWNRAEEVRAIQKVIARAKQMVQTARADESDRLWNGAPMQSIADQLHRALHDLDGAIPYAVCPTCQGEFRDQCLHCAGKGFLSKHRFDRTVPDEVKATRAKSCVAAVVTP